MTSRHMRLVLGGFLAHFKSIMEVFKAQTRGIEWRTICDGLSSFLKERNPLLGWKHPKTQILKGKSLKKKQIQEKEMGLVRPEKIPIFGKMAKR